MRRRLFKKYLFQILSPFFNWYLIKIRIFKFNDISVKVEPGVFHPGLFFSTKNLINFLEKENLSNKRFLELGAGTGLISVFASKKRAKVTASDLSITAVKNIEENFISNNVDARVIYSDLFEKIPPEEFDYIIINPPYYNKTPYNEKDYAWFCGEDYQYFRKLFVQIPGYINKSSMVIINLSEDCEVQKIREIASEHNIEFYQIKKIRNLWEWNYIFRLTIKFSN